VSPHAKLLEAALFAASRPLTLEELATLDPVVLGVHRPQGGKSGTDGMFAGGWVQ